MTSMHSLQEGKARGRTVTSRRRSSHGLDHTNERRNYKYVNLRSDAPCAQCNHASTNLCGPMTPITGSAPPTRTREHDAETVHPAIHRFQPDRAPLVSLRPE